MSKIIIGLSALVLLLSGFVVGLKDNPNLSLGSVEVGGEYSYASTTATQAGTKQLTKGTSADGLSPLPTTLGSIVVASSSATTLIVKNATSTTDIASTTAFTLKASAAEGTYTFDITLERGLILEVPAGFNGNYVTTWR